MSQTRVLVAQSCPIFGDPMDCSPPGSSVHGIFQARILEWVAMSFSRGSSVAKEERETLCLVTVLLKEIIAVVKARD